MSVAPQAQQIQIVLSGNVTEVQKVEIKPPCDNTSSGALSLFYFKAIKGACKESNNVLFDLPLKHRRALQHGLVKKVLVLPGGLVFVEAGKQKKLAKQEQVATTKRRLIH